MSVTVTNPNRLFDDVSSDTAEREIRAAEAALDAARERGASALVSFVQRSIEKNQLSAYVVDGFMRRRGFVVYVRVGVSDNRLDISERAELLQKIEDLWNARAPRPALSLIIEPANKGTDAP